jgi:hypothetical protein
MSCHDTERNWEVIVVVPSDATSDFQLGAEEEVAAFDVRYDPH